FLGGDGRSPCRDGATVRLPRRKIPTSRRPVERVRRGAEARIGTSRPVGRVVTRAATIERSVRDLVEMVPASRQPRVRKQVLRGVTLVRSEERRVGKECKTRWASKH